MLCKNQDDRPTPSWKWKTFELFFIVVYLAFSEPKLFFPTQDSVRGISETRPGVQLNNMVYNCKDRPTILRQDSKPGTTHHYRRNEVHTHHIHGANHRYTTSTTETKSKTPSLSREIQVPPRSSHEGEGRGPYQKQNKEKQFHTWSKEATERLSRSADDTNPSIQ